MPYHFHFTNPYPFYYEKRPKYPPSFFPSSSSFFNHRRRRLLHRPTPSHIYSSRHPSSSQLSPPATPPPRDPTTGNSPSLRPYTLRHLHHRHAFSNSPGFTSGHRIFQLTCELGHRSDGSPSRERLLRHHRRTRSSTLPAFPSASVACRVQPVSAASSGQCLFSVAGGEARGAGGGTPAVEMSEGVWSEEKIREGEGVTGGGVARRRSCLWGELTGGGVAGGVDVAGSWTVEKSAVVEEGRRRWEK